MDFAERLFPVLFGLILLRSLFSGWDLTYDFDLPKFIRWGVDLSIYTLPAVVALPYLRGPLLVSGLVGLAAYSFISLVAVLVGAGTGGLFGIEKGLTLTFINILQIFSIFVVCAALFQGKLRLDDRVLDLTARFGVIYAFACLLAGAAIGLHYINGGEPIVIGGKFFFISPISFRMSATFSEPSYLGFYMGFSALYFHTRHPGSRSIAFLILVGIALYLVVGAKFAIIAFPLALMMAPIVRRIPLTVIRHALYVFIIGLLVTIVLGFDQYIYRHVFTNIDFDDQQTFVTRFAYIFSSFRHSVVYPIGTGFGGWIFSLQSDMTETLKMTRGLDNFEIAESMITGLNFAPKDSTSLVLLIAGWLGIVGAIEGLIALLRQARRGRNGSIALVIYMALSTAVYINAIAVPMFFVLAIVVITEIFQSQNKIPLVLERYR